MIYLLCTGVCFGGAKIRTDFNPMSGLSSGNNFQASKPRGTSNRVLEVTVGANELVKIATAKQAAAFGELGDSDPLPASGTYAYMDADPACVTSKEAGFASNCLSITMPSGANDSNNVTIPSGTELYYYQVVGLSDACPGFDEYNPTSNGWISASAGATVSGSFANTRVCTHYFLQDKISAQDSASVEINKVGPRCIPGPISSSLCP